MAKFLVLSNDEEITIDRNNIEFVGESLQECWDFIDEVYKKDCSTTYSCMIFEAVEIGYGALTHKSRSLRK